MGVCLFAGDASADWNRLIGRKNVGQKKSRVQQMSITNRIKHYYSSRAAWYITTVPFKWLLRQSGCILLWLQGILLGDLKSTRHVFSCYCKLYTLKARESFLKKFSFYLNKSSNIN